MTDLTRTTTDECIIWTGANNGRGYGEVRRNRKKYYVHRLAWESANGPIPDGMFVLHRCDNPPCYNVDHLFLGTHEDNMADRSRKGRQFWRVDCPNGHPYSPENTYVMPAGTRMCKTCQRANKARYLNRKAAGLTPRSGSRD